VTNGLINLSGLQSALANQHKFDPKGDLKSELVKTSQTQELLNRELSYIFNQMNMSAVSVSDEVARREARIAAEAALRQAEAAVQSEAVTRRDADIALDAKKADKSDTYTKSETNAAIEAEADAREAQFEAIPHYSDAGYGLSQNDLTDTLLALLNSALQGVITSGDILSGDGTAASPLTATLPPAPAPPVPPAPTEDGEYVLVVSGGVATWAVRD
jgi:hypothetical protein